MKLRSKAKGMVLIPLFIGAILFVYVRTLTKFHDQVFVQLDNLDHNFIDKLDIASIVSNQQGTPLSKMKLHQVSLRGIERKVKSYRFVSDCEVSRDLKGNVLVNIKQNYPIARISYRNSLRKGGYLSSTGKILPLSKSYTARTLLISGEGTEKMLHGQFLQTQRGRDFIGLLSYIHENPFWKSQISHIEIDSKGRMSFFAQVGSQTILFGDSENFKQKLKKLDIFYKKVIPQQGWDRYKIINLEFEDQIVCS